jgi:poly(3-hydroxybutyrate) depolymerase
MIMKRTTLLLASLLLVSTSWMRADTITFSPGEGEFEHGDDPAIPRRTMRVLYHAPAEIGPETRVWFIIHGANRNPDSYRAGWAPHVRGDNVLAIFPEFSQENFPGAATFNNGHVRSRDGEIRPRETWTYSVIERIFDRLKTQGGVEAEHYLIYGHSAGSQFVHRMMFFLPETRAKGAFMANAGWYTMPVRDLDFPFGLRGMEISDERLAAVLGMPSMVLLGDQDTDEDHPQLSRSDGAMAQGTQRFARGQRFFETAQDAAKQLEAPLGWSMQIVEGVAHSNNGMAPAAARAMRDLEKGPAVGK